MTTKDEALKALDAALWRARAAATPTSILHIQVGHAIDALSQLKTALAHPETPPECQTEAEKTAFAFGWFKALEAQRLAQPKESERDYGVYLKDVKWKPREPEQEPVATSTSNLREMLDIINDTDSSRWEIGFRNIVAILYGPRHTFEIKDVVENVRTLCAHPPIPTAQPEQQEQLRFEVDGEMLTASQLIGVELFNFQQATKCDTAAEFLAQPAQEPVEMYRNKCSDGSRCLHGCHTNEPCYTTPPPVPTAQRKPLTDEDCTHIYNDANGIITKNPPITTERIFKAMRAAHGIKE